MIDFISNIHIFAARCNSGGFFGFPTWYKYLENSSRNPNECSPALTGINDIWLIGLAIVEILLRVAVLVAIAYVLLGGAKYILARGETGRPGYPDKINAAKYTVIDGLVGLVIALVAIAVLSFIARKFTQS
jgi:hypothetical protein